jgi:hypothetical protein
MSFTSLHHESAFNMGPMVHLLLYTTPNFGASGEIRASRDLRFHVVYPGFDLREEKFQKVSLPNV